MIVPTKDQGWYRVGGELAAVMSHLPGLRADSRQPGWLLAHRSALVVHDEAPALPMIDSGAWIERDRSCEARGYKLRVTQQQAIDFITRRRGAVLADDMRTGKTLAGLMCHDPTRGPLVIVAPLSTRGVWLGWAKRVFPQFADEIGVCVGKKFDRALLERPIVFMHYEILSHWASGAQIGTLILDEAHALTNPDTQRTIAAQLLASRAEQVIPMTGTPVWKFPPDFWAILNLANPGAWGNWYDFANRYGAPTPTSHGTKWVGVSNGPELHTRLSEVMLRRRWIDIADDLPAITRSVVVAEVSDAERKRLDILAAKLASDRTNTAGNFAHYRRVVAKLKLATAAREAKRITSLDEPAVVWTWHKESAEEVGELLRHAGRNVFVIHGDISPSVRDQRIAAWKLTTNGVLVANMAVAQVGLDFSHSRFAIFAEIDYTPAIIGQSEMRTFDVKRPMDILFIVANHFVDQRIVRALVAKLGAADPLGVAAAIDSIDALRDAVLGPQLEGDVDRLLQDLIASAA